MARPSCATAAGAAAGADAPERWPTRHRCRTVSATSSPRRGRRERGRMGRGVGSWRSFMPRSLVRRAPPASLSQRNTGRESGTGTGSGYRVPGTGPAAGSGVGRQPAFARAQRRRRTAEAHTRRMTTRRVLILLLVVMAVTVAVARTRQARQPPPDVTHLPRHGRGHRSPGRRARDGVARGDPRLHARDDHAVRAGAWATRSPPWRRVIACAFTLEVASDSVLATAFEVIGRDEAVAQRPAWRPPLPPAPGSARAMRCPTSRW